MQPLTDVQALIIDMDGVLWHGNKALPGLNQFFDCLRETQMPFILATNNASLTQDQYLSKLENMGVSVTQNEILTSSMATAYYLSEQTKPESTRVFVIGEQGLRQPLSSQGFQIINGYEGKPADYVVCGLDRKLTWDKLADASLHLHNGAKFIATNADTSLPTERGPVVGNGAILAALQSAMQISPLAIGKPKPIMYQQAIKLLATPAEQTVAIGDRLDTDILGAVNAGIRSIMVLTGISSEEDIKAVNYQPTWLMQDLPQVTQALQKKVSSE